MLKKVKKISVDMPEIGDSGNSKKNLKYKFFLTFSSTITVRLQWGLSADIMQKSYLAHICDFLTPPSRATSVLMRRNSEAVHFFHGFVANNSSILDEMCNFPSM